MPFFPICSNLVQDSPTILFISFAHLALGLPSIALLAESLILYVDQETQWIIHHGYYLHKNKKITDIKVTSSPRIHIFEADCTFFPR